MIISQTPLRISFLGGGTDFPAFYQQQGGAVISSAIDKYIFVILKERFDDRIRVGYTRTELVDHVDEVQHELVRECLRRTGIRARIEIATMADIPSQGSGLGSSSTVTVGLLNAMYAYQGILKDQESLAREACEIELERLGKPMGVQDQFIAAYGGQRLLQFWPDGRVSAERLALSAEERQRLDRHLMLFYTNVTRRSASVLQEQVANIPARMETLSQMHRLALRGRHCLESGAFDEFAALLDEGWQLKKQLASRVSNDGIDALYRAARQAGALGGKISGAGAGGFLMLYCPPSRQDAVRAALAPLSELPFRLDGHGTKVIFHYHR